MPATEDEVQAVRAQWAKRDLTPIGMRVERTVVTKFGGMDGEATVISHQIDGGRHYGALFVPRNAPSNAPMVVYLHGGDGGAAIPSFGTDVLIGGLGTIRDRVVYVIPSFRSEQLRFGRLTFVSGGQPSLWDRDVDDALMLVRAVASLAPQKVDAGRVLTMGFSRGAGVALLMGARDPGVQATITISGPTDFLGV